MGHRSGLVERACKGNRAPARAAAIGRFETGDAGEYGDLMGAVDDADSADSVEDPASEEDGSATEEDVSDGDLDDLDSE